MSLDFYKWFVPIKQNKTAKINLFCFPHAGGSASFFRKWAEQLLDQVNLYSLQLPGREERFSEPCVKDIHILVDLLTEIFLPKLDSKFIFFGHSIGALICFELAKSLYKVENICPSHLILSSHMPPSIPFVEHVSDLPNKQFINHLFKYEALPREIIQNKEILKLFLPFIRADFSLSESYKYYNVTSPLPAPITIWYGCYDDTINIVEIDKWGLETTVPINLKKFKGNHFYINSSSNDIIYELNNIIKGSIF